MVQDGVPITPGPDVRISTDGSGASTLDIPYAKLSDAAWYQCTAQNVAGSTATRARLFVETPKGAAPEPRRLNLPRPTKVIEPEWVFTPFVPQRLNYISSASYVISFVIKVMITILIRILYILREPKEQRW